MNAANKIECSCPCGETLFSVTGSPAIRFKCHCTICQAVYKKPYADVVAVKVSQVIKPLSPKIGFKKYRVPPALQRGTCPSCDNPVVAFLPVAPFFGLAFAPAVNFPEELKLPTVSMHTFYHRRVADIEDDLPKIQGYWSSQLAVTSRFFGAMWRGDKERP